VSRNPSSLATLRKLARRRYPTDIELKEFFDYLTTAEDRAFAIIAATALEDAIELAIRNKMIRHELRDLFGSDKPLGSFNAKVHMAFALGIIGPKSCDDLEVIRLVRNAFAHNGQKIDFNTPAVALACERLTMPERCEATGNDIHSLEKITEARERYRVSATLYQMSLIRRSRVRLAKDIPPPPPLD